MCNECPTHKLFLQNMIIIVYLQAVNKYNLVAQLNPFNILETRKCPPTEQTPLFSCDDNVPLSVSRASHVVDVLVRVLCEVEALGVGGESLAALTADAGKLLDEASVEESLVRVVDLGKKGVGLKKRGWEIIRKLSRYLVYIY